MQANNPQILACPTATQLASASGRLRHTACDWVPHTACSSTVLGSVLAASRIAHVIPPGAGPHQPYPPDGAERMRHKCMYPGFWIYALRAYVWLLKGLPGRALTQ